MSDATAHPLPSRLLSTLTDKPAFYHTLAMTGAAWAVHVVLRCLELGRPTPFGTPFVEKFDWYIFHAVAYDILISLPLLLPLLLFYGLLKPVERPGALRRLPLWIGGGLYGLYLLFTVGDHELMRFMAVHGSLDMLATYFNAASMRDYPALVAADQGGAYLPVILAVGAPALFAGLSVGWGRWLAKRRPRLHGALIALVVLPLASYLLLFHIWKGSFRMEKLQPWPVTVVGELQTPEAAKLTPEEYVEARDAYRALWQSDADRPWVFPLPDHPFARLTLEDACAARLPAVSAVECDADADADGHPARDDCDDHDPTAYPGAEDVPGNGVDEDCSGADARPWNVVLISLETHRALNVGHLKPFGARDGATPALDALAARNHFWTRHAVNGLPTIEGFFSMQCSIYSKGTSHAATSETHVSFQCLPPLLKEQGYRTRFFTATAPDWDNQTFWLGHWYDDYDFDRDRQTDLTLFHHMGAWMRDNFDDTTPFFAMAMTKSNHFPFNAVEDMTEAEKKATPDNINTTMGYTDRALADFFDLVKDAPWFAHTVFIITADHGFNLGEHGSWRYGDPLHRASTWVPLVIVGDHPKLTRLPNANLDLSSHADLMPTILDLLGMDGPTSAVGHSMLRSRTGATSYIHTTYANDIAFEQGGFRTLVSPPDLKRQNNEEIFDNIKDFYEFSDLSKNQDVSSELHARTRLSRQVTMLTRHALQHDAVWPRRGLLTPATESP